MLTEKEILTNLIQKQKDCEFSLRFALRKETGVWKNCFALLQLVKREKRKEISYDYGDLVLGERILSIKDGLSILSDVYPKNGEKGKLVIPGYDEFILEGRSPNQAIPSRHRYGYLRSDWPLRFWVFTVQQDKISRDWNRELLSEGSPYYPNLNEVVMDFFGLQTDYFGSYGEFYIVVVDYRARIESLRLRLSKVELRVISPEIEFKDLVIKVFARFGARTTTLPDIYPKSDTVEFDVGFQPDSLYVALLDRSENMKVDGKIFTKWGIEEEGISVERPEEEIVLLTRAGESQNLEYKYQVDSEDKKTDFIESVIAFLNTNRGIIMVGVDDSGNIVGCKKDPEDIHKMIHDSCDPPPRNIKVERKSIAENDVLIVEVPEGDNKPYQSKRDKKWYIRHNANDMEMERSELFHLLEKYMQGKTWTSA